MSSPTEAAAAVWFDDADSIALLQVAVELGNIATWRHDLHSGIVRLDSRSRAVLGFAPPDGVVSVDQLRELMHPDDWAPTQEAAATALRSNGPVDGVVRYRRSEGGWRSVMLRRTVQRAPGGRPIAFVGTAMDISERLERDRREQELIERFDLVRRSVGFGTWFLDLQSGNAVWDEQMWTLRGRPPLGRHVTDADRDACVHPDDRVRIAAKISAAMASRLPFEHEFRVITPDGEERWLASRSMELHDDPTGLRRRFGVNWDVTDSRNARLARRQQELAQSEMRAKAQFLSRMSHELRTPLNAVLGFSELLLARETGADIESTLRSGQLEHVRKAGQHLLALINDVLDLTSVEGGEVRIGCQPVALGELFAETAALVDPERRAAGVELQVGDAEGSVLADPRRLRQVLLNLLSNAIKYNHSGGLVRVESLQRPAGRAIRVTDDGEGMNESQLQQLFEPFNRLGRDAGTVEGTGIGLAIVKALVERMGGSIRVESTEGQGTQFEVMLPDATQHRMPPSDTPTPQADAQSRSVSTPQRHVLYIEDNPINALIVTELLASRKDLILSVAVDGSSGVADARRLRPALILLDMQLPDFDGFEVLRRLRADAFTAAIPCVALSANAMPEDIQRAMKAGMTDYWTKPLDFKRFMAALDGLFARPA